MNPARRRSAIGSAGSKTITQIGPMRVNSIKFASVPNDRNLPRNRVTTIDAIIAVIVSSVRLIRNTNQYFFRSQNCSNCASLVAGPHSHVVRIVARRVRVANARIDIDEINLAREEWASRSRSQAHFRHVVRYVVVNGAGSRRGIPGHRRRQALLIHDSAA